MASEELTAKQPVFAGINNVDIEEEIGSAYLLTADNVDITRQSRIVRRQGYTQIFSGSVAAAWGNGSHFLFISGGVLRRLNADYTTTGIVDVNPSVNVLEAIELFGGIYWTNTSEIGVIRNNINYSISPPAPVSLPNITTSVGDLPRGNYLVAITFINTIGEEGPASRVEILPDITEGSIVFSNFTIPLGVEKIAIYLSKTNGEILYRALVINIDNLTTVTYSNNTSELKYPLRTQYLSLLPAGHLIEYFRGHLLVAKENILYFSESYNVSLYNPTGGFVPFQNKITNVKTVREGVFVATENEVIFLAGTNPSEWSYTRVSPFGVAIGTMLFAPGELLGESFIGNDRVVIWPTIAGLFAGTDTGSIVNLTSQIFHFPPSTYGSSLLRSKNGQNHFVIITG